jgi:hypothetical protein
LIVGYKSLLLLLLFSFLFSCNKKDTNPVPTQPIGNLVLKGNVNGNPWEGSIGWVKIDTNYDKGRNDYQLWIWEDRPDAKPYISPCYDRHYRDSGNYYVYGRIPTAIGDHDLTQLNGAIDYGIYFERAYPVIYDLIRLNSNLKIKFLDTLGEKLRININGNATNAFLNGGRGELIGEIDCNVCINKGDYQFRNMPLMAMVNGDTFLVNSGLVSSGTPGTPKFYLSGLTQVGNCTDILIKAQAYIYFFASINQGVDNRINGGYWDPISRIGFLAEYGAMEALNVDTINNLVDYRIDLRGEGGFRLMGNHQVVLCKN